MRNDRGKSNSIWDDESSSIQCYSVEKFAQVTKGVASNGMIAIFRTDQEY